MDVEKILEPRVYEVGYHILPNVPEADLESHVDAIRKAVTDLGGLPIKEGKPYLMDLAYPMEKVIENKKNIYNQAYFGWIKFDLPPQNTESLKTSLEENRNILRYLFISTVKEDTFIAEGKFSDRTKKPERKPVKKDEGVVDEAKLDSALDELTSEGEE